MKAIIETVTGVKINRDIDTAESPIGILKSFYTEDSTAASQVFSDQKSIDQLMEGNVDEERSAFELITVEGTNIRANWKEPLCNQPAIKEELSKLEAEGQIPTFVVSVCSIVA